MKFSALTITLLLASSAALAKPRKVPTANNESLPAGMVKVVASATSKVKSVAQETAMDRFEAKMAILEMNCPSMIEIKSSESTMKIGKPGYNRRYISKVSMTAKCNN